MTRNKIEQDLNVPFMGLFKETVQVFVRTIPCSCLLIIPYIISRILEGRIEAGVYPQGVGAQALYVIKLAYYTVKITYPVAVAVAEGLGVDLVENRFLQPIDHI